METSYLYICIVVLVTYLFITHLRRKSANHPPTVFPCIPIIGHLYLLKPPLYRTLAKISAKHGPILQLQFGFRRVLLISSPSATEECLSKNDIIFANRPKTLYGKIIGANYTTLSGLSYGEVWRNLRRIASVEILSAQRLNEFHDIRVNEIKLLIRKLLKSNSSPVIGKSMFHDVTLNVMMRMISGKRYFGSDNRELEAEGKLFQKLNNETMALATASNVGDYLPFLSWFGVNSLEKKLIALQEKRDAFFQRLIEQVRNSKGFEVANGRKTMIELLLSLQKTEPENYSDAMIRTFVLGLLGAGSDTTAGTMEWILSLLLNHPHVLKKAQAEIDRAIGNKRLVDESDAAKLPYIICIINETLRLYPAGPLLFPHESSEDSVIGGYNIPRGTMLIINQWGIHHDPKLWNEPEKFIPERFEGIEGTRDGFKLMPFGSGRRGCPGEGLAIRMLVMTIGSIIQCFDWEPVSDDGMVDMSEGIAVTLPKKVPLVAKCKPRPEMANLLSEL